ncbi:MAG: hypothetical protein ACKVYV_04390 [Limisphaerales bacterium]
MGDLAGTKPADKPVLPPPIFQTAEFRAALTAAMHEAMREASASARPAEKPGA